MFGITNWKCLKFTHAILEAKARGKTHIFCSGLIFFLLFLWNITPLPHPFTLVFFPEIKYCRIWPNALRQFLSDGIIFINRLHNFFSQECKMQSEERWRDRGNSMPSPCLTSLVHRGVWQCTFYSGSICVCSSEEAAHEWRCWLLLSAFKVDVKKEWIFLCTSALP